jgi:anaerobic selenocysteine-containing dehydrogenase
VEGFDRRKFLKGSSVAAGLAGAMTVLPGAVPAFANTTRAASHSASKSSAATGVTAGSATTGEPIVAHIRDAGNGQIDLFVGTRHVSVHDRNLTNQILNAVN